MFLTTETKRELTLEENRSVQMTIDYSYQCPLLKGVVYHMVQISSCASNTFEVYSTLKNFAKCSSVLH